MCLNGLAQEPNRRPVGVVVADLIKDPLDGGISVDLALNSSRPVLVQHLYSSSEK